MLACVEKFLNIAKAEEGYLEKASNSQLDSKTANAGTGNFTKYARDLDAIDNFYNGKKNGFAWCDVFVDWCFVQAFGVEKALALTCQPWGSTGAGVGFSKEFYRAKGQLYTTPEPGDQVFFGTDHTGIVYDVDSTYFYTVEGNTGPNTGVIDEGDGVYLKKYSRSSSSATFGRPDWSLVSDEETEDIITKDQVISANRYLSMDEMKINARYIAQVLTDDGWTLNAIAGMLGNMQTESTINPGIWQSLDSGNTSLGYGLVQWTPATKYLNWCSDKGIEPSDIDSAISRIEWELENGEQYYATDSYPLSFREFKTSTKSAEYLAMAFLNNYERPADRDQPARGTQATFWYDYLSGFSFEGGGGTVEPDEPEIPDNPPVLPARDKRKMSLLLLISAAKRR